MQTNFTYKRTTLQLLAVLLVLTLAWLSVSLPFVYEARQQLTQQTDSKEKDRSNPLSGTTDEKVPSNPNVNINEEYLHAGNYDLSIASTLQNTNYIHTHESIYIAFHPELHAPPPNSLA
ncbi:hypothetical protein [Niabella soli]|uniref:Uncharacterized protein n=1 Tax=Niabella soli DSM 19437 TaxID=929713 RepID=W0F7Y5_9BACT|nr:hypothetical protein [Niabella soli]AHF17569.1 hypothetical protein NIASO_10070 [Niabella soli DSM 19437]